MFTIPLILGSTRRDRQSPKAARYLLGRLQASGKIRAELLDLAEYNFPIMEERIAYRDDPPPRTPEFAGKLQAADAIVIVSPEYNSGYPGVLKNALDYFYPEYERKPFGIATVSAGGFGGINCLGQLRQVVLALGGVPIPERLPFSKINGAFNADGTPTDPRLDKQTQGFIDELLWWTEAAQTQRKKDGA